MYGLPMHHRPLFILLKYNLRLSPILISKLWSTLHSGTSDALRTYTRCRFFTRRGFSWTSTYSNSPGSPVRSLGQLKSASEHGYGDEKTQDALPVSGRPQVRRQAPLQGKKKSGSQQSCLLASWSGLAVARRAVMKRRVKRFKYFMMSP